MSRTFADLPFPSYPRKRGYPFFSTSDGIPTDAGMTKSESPDLETDFMIPVNEPLLDGNEKKYLAESMPHSESKVDADLPVTVYTPDSSLASPRQMLRDMVRDLLASRELAWRLAVRDISAQYRQAFLGILWAFILPLANTLVWVFLSGAGIV